MIQYKNNESLPQANNDERANIRKHTCKAKWYGLQSRNTLSNKPCQHGRIKSTHQEKRTEKTNHKKGGR